jgi:hypothetical protein
MDLSKLSIGLYEIMGLIFPGFLAISEVWIAARGWDRFMATVWAMNWIVVLVLAIASFAIGGVVQELAHVVVGLIRSKEDATNSRKEFWASPDARLVKRCISSQLGEKIESVEAAFDFCLTKIEERFPKRDTFMATADLAGVLIIIAVLGLGPICRLSWTQGSLRRGLIVVAVGTAVAATIAVISWRRTVRFRELADLTVFRVYVATCDRLPPAASASVASTAADENLKK